MKKISLILSILAFFLLTINPKLNLAQESSPSGDTIRERVKEKIESTLNKPKAFLGTITDKTENTLQIKNTKGEIQFISIDADKTKFILISKTNKILKFDDIAIGDFVIAMGYISKGGTSKNNGNTVLEAKRILITEQIIPTTRKIIFGNVTKIEKKIISVYSNQQEMQFEFPKKWNGPEIEEISIDNRVAIVSTPQDGKLMIRTIEIVGKKESESADNTSEN